MSNDTDTRLTELEIKLTLAEDLLERLDAIVVKQQRTIDALAAELARLAREQVAREDEPGSASGERPPHY